MRLGKGKIKKWDRDLRKAQVLLESTKNDMNAVYLNSKGGRTQNVGACKHAVGASLAIFPHMARNLEILAKSEGVDLGD